MVNDQLKGVEILLVEDNPNDAELTIRALKKKHFANEIMWVKDGAEALDFVFAKGNYSDRDVLRPPKVILLDLHLPKVDGMTVLKKIKDDERTRAIPIVILTSSKEDRDVAESYKLGVNSFISKPVAFEEFSNTVSALGLYWLLINRPPL